MDPACPGLAIPDAGRMVLFATTRTVAIPVGIGAFVSAALGVLLWVLSFAAATSTLEVGDCFDFEFSSSTGQVANLILASCTGPHHAEVYATVTHDSPPDAPYPGEDALVDEAFFLCLGEFQGFVGRSYDESALDIFVHVPDSSAWTVGNDRISLCSLFRVDLEPLRGTARGSGL